MNYFVEKSGWFSTFVALIFFTVLSLALPHPLYAIDAAQFQDVTASVGISYTGASWGASWGDFNSDGKPDLWVGNHENDPNLYLNQGNGTFVDIASSVWPNPSTKDTHGAAWADFDNDGDQDLLELVGAQHGLGTGGNHFFVNQNGQLADEAASKGLAYSSGRGRTPLWVDWNRDSRLDVVISTAERPDGQAPSVLLEQTSAGTFVPATAAGFSAAKTAEFTQLADLTGDGKMELIIDGSTPYYPQRIYDTSFTPLLDLTSSIGLPTTRYITDVVIADLTGDARNDLLELRHKNSSDVAQANETTLQGYFFLQKEEDGLNFQTSSNVTFAFGSYQLTAAGIYIGAKGWHPSTCCTVTLSPTDPTVAGLKSHTPAVSSGVYIGYDTTSATWNLRLSSPGNSTEVRTTITSTSTISGLTPVGFVPADRFQYNRFLAYNSTAFQDQTVQAGLATLTACNSGAAGDFDNDMDLDLYLVCGRPVQNIPNILYENLGTGTFSAVTGAGGATGTTFGVGGDVAVADYDMDGFLDLFITNGFNLPAGSSVGPDQLFRNLGNGNRWLKVDLVGTTSNRDGIGAKLLLSAGGITQLREQSGGIHNRSQNHQRVHFGLGGNTLADQLTVTWPNGTVQTLQNIPTNQILQIIEP